ncbi:FecCD family ABC transporter permease [Aeromonas rivuli]|jgi:iron complex transport system permease protein|uniref:FecCD family ABC transporter permease n=1 Tax=Aeromonas TaxID=642 RepID=UPI0005A6B7A1|nr:MULTISPECIES: iron ABC transporter permease [Aeromonas]MCS3459810.1 iron complex transport system permease protein [Aeromonas sp. BIGb0445]UBO74937.1 iron ABC transporter permease [Aeromonas rivuli]
MMRLPLPWLLLGLGLLLSGLLLGSLATGPLPLSFSESLQALLASETSQLAPHKLLVVQEIRLPRTLLCLAVGGILGLCGAVMQGLFRNPLADPGIIGVSGGAALGAALAIVLLAPLEQQLQAKLGIGLLPLLAFLGGAITTTLVYLLGSRQGGTSVTVMLLAGVAITALSGAVMGLLSYLADDQMLRDLSLWQMGTLAAGKPADMLLSLATLAILLLLFSRDAGPLNALLLGESEARHLGVNVQSLKRRLILLTAAGVGVAVAIAGMIGFVGLVVPHLVRLLCGPNHVRLLPLSALVGAALLLGADMLARTLLAPAELPVGIITALLGAPFFIWLLLRGRRTL